MKESSLALTTTHSNDSCCQPLCQIPDSATAQIVAGLLWLAAGDQSGSAVGGCASVFYSGRQFSLLESAPGRPLPGRCGQLGLFAGSGDRNCRATVHHLRPVPEPLDGEAAARPADCDIRFRQLLHRQIRDLPQPRNAAHTCCAPTSPKRASCSPPDLLLHLLPFAVLPLAILHRLRLRRRSLSRGILLRSGAILLAAMIGTGALSLVFKGFAAQMRNHKEIRYLITPANAVYSLGRVLVNDAKAAQQPATPDRPPMPCSHRAGSSETSRCCS
jgi:hypothetical protein